MGHVLEDHDGFWALLKSRQHCSKSIISLTLRAGLEFLLQHDALQREQAKHPVGNVRHPASAIFILRVKL